MDTTEQNLSADYTDFSDFSVKINRKGRVDFLNRTQPFLPILAQGCFG